MPRISACKFRRTFVHLNSRTAAQVVVAIRYRALKKTKMKSIITLTTFLSFGIQVFGQQRFNANSLSEAAAKIKKLDPKTHILKCMDTSSIKNSILFVQAFALSAKDGKLCPVLKLAETKDNKNYEVKTLFSFKSSLYILSTCSIHLLNADEDSEPEIFLRCTGDIPENGELWEWVTPLDDLKSLGKEGLPFPKFITVIKEQCSANAFMISTPKGEDPIFQIKAALVKYEIIK